MNDESQTQNEYLKQTKKNKTKIKKIYEKNTFIEENFVNLKEILAYFCKYFNSLKLKLMWHGPLLFKENYSS